MPRHRILDRFLQGSLLAAPALLLSFYSWTQAQTPGPQLPIPRPEIVRPIVQLAQNPADPAQPPKRHEYMGPDSCQGCHGAPVGGEHPTDFVLLNESVIFKDHDKHRLAFELLKGELGKEMTTRLKIEDISEAKQCLSCHANWHSAEGYPRPDHFERGVSCESCHGPASDYFQPHIKEEWRKTPIAEKVALGMVDVRNPISRAQQCLSCHIGNVEQGKVVTHEMYAAGHPPLPSIEIESFASQMPPHWRYLQEKGDFKFRKEFIEQTTEAVDHDPMLDLPRARSVVLGGVMELQTSLKLFADLATTDSNNWPELAAFDCSACHHDLKSPSWRQARGYVGRPGRPTMTAWPTILAQLGIEQRAGGNQQQVNDDVAILAAQLHALRQALDAQPFGHPDQVKAASEPAIAWLDTLAQDLVKKPFTREDAVRSLAALEKLAAGEIVDYHSARQIAWGMKTIATELQAPYPEFPATKEQLAQWQIDVRDHAVKQVDDEFQAAGLNEHLFLKLPAGQETKISERLPILLRTMSEYDPVWFRQAAKGLATELQK